MSGASAHKQSRQRPVSARARLRPKSQLTLPEEVRRALRVNEGDELEFKVDENGTITVRGYISVPTEHAWLYEAHQRAHQPAEHDYHAQSAKHESAEALFAYLDSLGATDA